MEVVYTDVKPEIFDDNKITGFYGDVVDLLRLKVDIEGIIYDDNWTVKRFLSGHFFKINNRIISICNYLEINLKILSKKLNEISKRDFKFVLLAKVLLENKINIIFDYVDVGLNYKDQKKLIKIIRMLKRDGKTIIIISKNLVFLNQIVDSIKVPDGEKIIFDGSIDELIKTSFIDEPEIIKFIKLANKSGAKLDFTLDSKELLKDIYRGVY